MPSPTVSVVLPVRNAVDYLSDALTSVERNAVGLGTNVVQLVVVDDGSDDGTGDVIAEYAERLPWLDAIRHDAARGLADARNAGLDVASGRYVTFLDGDDWYGPTHLADLVGAIEGLGCDVVRTDHVEVRGRGRTIRHAPEARRGVVLDPRSGIVPVNLRTMVDYAYSWAGIYRRELGDLLRFPAGLHTAEDRPWIWRLHRHAPSYAVVSLAGVFYRRLVADSLTQIGDARQLHFVDAYTTVLREAATDGDPDVLDKAVRQFYAVLSHQVGLAQERFSEALRTELTSRARTLLAEVDPAVLARMLPYDKRGQLLEPLVPAAVLRNRRVPA